MLKKSALCLCGICGDVLVGWFTMICPVVLTVFLCKYEKKPATEGLFRFFCVLLHFKRNTGRQ